MFFRKSRNEKIAIEISRGLFGDFEKFVATTINNYREYDEITTRTENHISIEMLTLFLWLVRVDQILSKSIHKFIIKNIHLLYYDYLSEMGMLDNEIKAFNTQLTMRYELYDNVSKEGINPKRAGLIYKKLRENDDIENEDEMNVMVEVVTIFSKYKSISSKYKYNKSHK